MFYNISLIWVLLGAVAYYAIGALWYSPMLFAKAWTKEVNGRDGEMKMSAEPMIIAFVAILLAVTVEAYFIHATGTSTLMRAGYLGAKLWLGFAATTGLVNNVFQGASRKLWLIDQGYHLVGFVVAAMVIVH